MIELMNTQVEYWHWLVFGMILIASEIFVTSFILMWFGLSAVVLAIILLVMPLGIELQLFIWVSLALLDIFAWFKFIRPKWKDKTLAGMGHEALIGQIGLVIDANHGKDRGKLKFPAPILGEDEWVFICTEVVEIGVRVQVLEVSGNSLIVKRHGA